MPRDAALRGSYSSSITPLATKRKTSKDSSKNTPVLKVKVIPKRAPNLNPVERLVNKPLKSVVCMNKSCSDVDDVIRVGCRLLTK
ncbi:MAG: hypothetical protein JRN59_06835 [Nitrososphaerota archaeon]|nr:hypothetical protein [Nitrososphaerota archaeon]